jgi:hypothetical protein
MDFAGLFIDGFVLLLGRIFCCQANPTRRRFAFNRHGADIKIRDRGKRDLPPDHGGLNQAAVIGFILLALLGVLLGEAIYELASYEGGQAVFTPCLHGLSHHGYCGH